MSARLTPSSYAVLGLLALRSWSAYELAQQATRSLRFAWPKSESHLYAEPKKLVALGLAAVRTEPAGQRTRRVYAITPPGREALQAWLDTEPEPPTFESEALLRLLFADQGDTEQLLAAIDTLQTQARELYDQGQAVLAGYLDGAAPFPDRLHLSVLFASFQADLYHLISQWAGFARAEIENWPSTARLGLTPRTAEILRTLHAHHSALTGDRLTL